MGEIESLTEAWAGPVNVFVVHGVPAPQGSKRHVGGGVMVESSKKVKPWREAVKWAVLSRPEDAKTLGILGPVRVSVTFFLQRPGGHYGTGRNAGVLKASAPEYPAVKPDLDKIVRSTLDALTDAGVYRDDSQVVTLISEKLYGNPGALIAVQGLSTGSPIDLDKTGK